MAITSTGLGSGLDIEGLVSQLVSAERDPAVKKLTTRGTTITNKVSALGTLNGALSALQTAARGLQSTSQYVTPKITSSDDASVSGTAAASAKLATHTVNVTQLAQSQRLTTGAFASVDDVVGSGKLIIDFGKITKLDGTPATTDAGGFYDETNIKFTPNSEKSSFIVTIDSEHNTLSGIRDVINGAGGPVTASIVNDGTGFRLVLASTDSGESNSLRITVSDDAGGSVDTTGLSQLAYDVTRNEANGQNLSQVAAATSAKLTVDGVAVTAASNTASGIISGLTLNLKKVTTSPITLTVGRDSTGAAKGMESFVDAYNKLRSTIKEVSFFDPATKSAGPLQGESAVRSIDAQIRSLINTTVPAGTFSRLSDLGISFDKSGLMTYDSSKFNAAVAKDAGSVAALLGNYGVTSDSQVSFFSAASSTKPGKYGVAITQIATQGKLVAGTAVPSATNIDLTATTNTFSIKVNGASSGTITLSPQNYATAGDLALTLQAQINGDANLKSVGATVSVGFDSGTGKFTITSNRFGSTSDVVMTTLSTDLTTALGLSTSDASTPGLDVAGSIGSSAGKGEGQYLTGAGEANGLKIQVGGTLSGSRGTVSYSKGFAVQINELISSMMSDKGIISVTQKSLNDSLDTISDQLERLDTRMKDLEKRYRAQFTALDVTISSLRSTSTYLSQQLANLPSSSS